MTAKKSKSKPEVEFQYGGRLFIGTGSSFISTVDWGIWWKFDMPITAFNRPKIWSINRAY